MERRYDIDYIRVIAFAILIVYHVCVFFYPGSWHIKNDVLYPQLNIPMVFVNQWRLPLLFVISGMGTYFALGKKSWKQYAVERTKRLLLPFIFGVLFIIPPQVYIERISQGADYGGYFHFWPSQIFNGIYPEGNFSWHHLWFILYLFFFSLVFLPLFQYIKKNKNNWLSRTLTRAASSVGGILLMALPLLLCRMLLSGNFPQTNGFWGDWFNMANSALFFILGFALIDAGEKFWKNVEKHKWIFLSTGVCMFSLLLFMWMGPFSKSPVYDLINDTAVTLNAWCWILAIIGLCSTYLNKPSKGLKYANEAVYPFYILHQTVMVILGYFIRNWSAGFLIKFPAMIILTFLITWVIYEFGIRRYRIIRPLFGMKNQPKAYS